MMSMQKNAITIKKALLIFAIIIFVVACIAGCGANADTSDKTEGMAEDRFRNQMAKAGVTEIEVKKDLVLETPVEMNGTKILYGEGSITAIGDAWTGDEYMIVVPSGAQLTVKGSVCVNADGITGGIRAAQGAEWTIEETASVKNASAEAANTLVEGKFHMNGGTMSDAMGHNVYNMGEVTVSQGEIIGSGTKCAGIYSEGILTQNGGTIRDAYNNVVVLSGGFNFNAGNNQGSVRDGVYAAEGTKLSVAAKEAVISGSGVRGIYLCGEATIDGVTLSNSGDSLMKISQTGTLNLKGGTLADAGYHSIENAGKMVMTGGSIRNSYNCGIVNTGTLDITGGSFLDNVKNKAVLNKHDGKATISGQSVMFSGNRFAVANEDTATLDLTKAEFLLSTTTNVYAYDGTVNIHDVSFGASGSNNVRIYKAEVTMNNVQVLGNSKSGSGTTHGILLEGGTLDAKDLTIKNTTGYGIRNKGGHVTAENLLISKSLKAGGISSLCQDHTGVPGVMDIKNLTIEEIRYNNIVVEGGTVTVTDGHLAASGTNNVKTTDGVLNLTDVDILGNQEGVDGTNHAVYMTGGKIVAKNVNISDAKVSCLRINGETAVFTGDKVSIKNATKYGIDQTVGEIHISNLTMAENYYNISNTKGIIKLSNSTLGPTKSNNLRSKGGWIDLRNVAVNGHTKDHVKNVHALFIDGGSLTGQNITVKDVSNVGLRVKGGTTNVRGLTVNDAGADGVWISAGKATVYDLVVKKAGAAGITATDTGKITVIGGSIKNTANHGVKSENNAKVTLENTSVAISTTDGRHAVLAQGGDIHLEDVKVTGLEKNITGFGIRINKETSHVSGKGVHIADVNTGISATAGTSDISGVTTDNVAYHSAYASGTAKLVISDSEFGVTGTNNAKAENGGTLTLNNTVIAGTTKNHGIMVEKGGYFYGKDITVQDTAGCAVRVKCSDEGNHVEIDGLVTENIGAQNVLLNKDQDAANSGSVVIKNGDLCRTGAHSVRADAGNLTLVDTKIQGHLSGTANDIHAIYVCDKVEKVNLEGVSVLDSAGDALRIGAGEVQANNFTSQKTGRFGIWASAGKLTAQNTTVSGSGIGVHVSGEAAVVLNGADISGSGLNNIKVTDVELIVNGYADGSKSLIGTATQDNVVATDGGVIRLNDVDVKESAANNIVATGGKVYVTDSTVTGGNYSILAQAAGYAELTNVTITDSVKDGIRVNKADGEVVVNNVQIVNPVRYGVSAEKGSVALNGDLTITSNADQSGAIYAYNGGKVTSADGAKVTISGTENGICVESDAAVALGNVAISECAKNGVKVTSGTAVLNGVNVSGSGSNNMLVSGGELAVNGYADGSKSQIGTCAEDNIRASGAGVIRLDKVSVSASAKNNVVAIDNGTVYMTDSSVTGGNHSVLAQDGKVTLTNVSIQNSKTSGIRANRAGSVVEATGVTIDGAAKGLSVQYGTVQVEDITIRNTTEVGVFLEGANVADGTTVTLNNLVTENCGTNAIYTSGAHAKLTIGGANLSNDGSDHVIYLNGGPMALNDVAINGTNLAAGQYELFSGAGWLTIGGAMDADIYIATDSGRVIKVNKELTGNNLTVDWKNAPTGNALEFTDAAMMEASKDNIRLGAIQSAAGSCLYYYSRYAKLVSNVVTNETELKEYLEYAQAQNMTDVTILIGDSFTVAEQVTIPACITNLTIQDDGNAETTNTVTYSGSTDGLFAMRSDLKLTVQDIALSSTSKVLLKQTCGTTELNGVTLSGGTNNIYVTDGTVTVNGGQIGASTADNVKAEATGVIELNDVDISGSGANGVVAINGGKISMTDSSVTGGGHSVLAQDGEVTLNNVAIRNSANSAIRANRAGSVVNATDVTIEGAKTGLSIQCGTVVITDIAIRNTTEVGVSVAQNTSDANVTLTNLVTENCGTHAIYTSGAAAKLTVNGATLANDGSDHVINLNGGPMVLNDVAINGTNLAAGKYELYSGAGWLTIGGAMDADIYIAANNPSNANAGRVVKVNKELTGNNLVIDWKNTPTGNAIEFSSEAMMEASKDNITLGKTQADAGKLLHYTMDGTKAVAVVVDNVISSEAELDVYLNLVAQQGMTDVTILIGDSFNVVNQVTVPASITNLTILDDGNTATGNTVTYTGSTDGLFVMHSGLKLTVNDISLASTQKVLLKQTCGTSELNGVALSGGTNNIYVTDGTVTVNGGQIGASTADNVKAEATGVIELNDVDISGSGANGVVAISGGEISMTDSSVTGGGHSVLAQDGEVTLTNVTIRNSTNSAIRANRTGSVVNATDVTIDGSAKGLSIQYGTVVITGITIRNTTNVGVNLEGANVADGTNVTLTNLVTENCGTYAIYTSGANAKLTVNGATLANDGSDHVINLNGGPMVLHDVAINGTNLAADKYELYSGAGWLTIGGAMDADIYIAANNPSNANSGRVVKVNKELTGNNLVIDWKNTPVGTAIEFTDAAMMEASKDNITLGDTQAASYILRFEGKAATLAPCTVVSSWSDLSTKVSAQASGSQTTYRITGDASNWTASAPLAIPAGAQVTLFGDKNSPAIVVASGVSPFTLNADTVLTLENLVVGGTAEAKAAHIIVPASATLSLKNTTMQYFGSSHGGAVHVNKGTLTAAGSTFANNSSSNWGGAIGIWGGTVNVSGSTFTGNTSKNSGGAIINYKADGGSLGGSKDNAVGNLTLTNCVFTNNTSTAEHGGAVASWAGGTTTITGCTFENNSAKGSGGAVHVTDSHQVTVANCGFTSNTATADGGAIYHKSSVQMTVTGSSFTGNKGTEGGAISTVGSLQVSGTEFIENQSTTGRAGAVMIWNAVTVEFNDCEFSGNTAKTNGGAVAKGGNSGGVLKIIDCDFEGNSAPNGEGGVLMLQSSPSVTITGSTFTGNSAKTNGGVIKNNSSTTGLKIENSEFSNNTAGGNGGVLYQQDGNSANLSNCIFTGNTATSGNAVHSVGGTVTLTGGNIQEADCSGKFEIVKE